MHILFESHTQALLQQTSTREGQDAQFVTLVLQRDEYVKQFKP